MNNSNLKILQQYLQKITPNNNKFTLCVPNINLGIVVVIPCYNEPDIIKTLVSIEKCEKPNKSVEVIIVINSHETSDNEVIEINKNTENQILEWQKTAHNYKYHILHVQDIPKKHAGVGYVRKLGMDNAIQRFADMEIGNGIICSLDADTLVEQNYFVEIEKTFQTNNCNACSIYFEHDIKGSEFSSEIYKRITEYELHLRYYSNSLKYSGFPHYYYTIGSAFAVSANAYCMQGGMNKKQAGEDFYFLQKIMQMGNFKELNTTTVYPSSRPSDRVIFGTGPVVYKYSQQPDKKFLTYNFDAFVALKKLFDDKMLFFKINNNDFNKIISSYHASIQDFLNTNNFKSAINNINNNIAHIKNFNRKFFHWFDGFRVVKYINFAHENYFEKTPLSEACNRLMSVNAFEIENYKSSEDLLIKLRILDSKHKAGSKNLCIKSF